ncbi:Sec20-domain-containing protein [Amylostereum chailletii]|nr:Sec20-domain-containing protein [Amylostereum chailletii]
MAPLPSTFDEGVSGVILSIQRRSRDMNDVQLPRLRSCKESLAVQQQYAAELHEDLEVVARLVQELDEAVEDQKGNRARQDLKAIVEGFRTDVGRLRQAYRTSLLASKRAIDANIASKREELLRSSVMREKQTSEGKITEDALMKANNDVTDALRRTLGLMQGELERSVLSTQMLEASTATLKSTSSTHDVLTGLMGTSKQLITALEKSDWLDRLLILAALAFFLTVVMFILKQRIFDRGMRIAFWWTRFLPDTSIKVVAKQASGTALSSVLTTSPSAAIASSLAVVASSGVASSLLSSAVATSVPSLSVESTAREGYTFDLSTPQAHAPSSTSDSDAVFSTAFARQPGEGSELKDLPIGVDVGRLHEL